jgi:hypothetical protein
MVSAVNEQFNRFVSFALERVQAGKDTAIATKGEVEAGEGALEERGIRATDKTDFVGMSLLRGGDTKRANDEVRELFKKSISEMFGGELNIPESVKDAMLLKDYGCGKPLTARRILAVKDAIEELDRSNIFDPETDKNGELAQIALDAGYERIDFGKLNTAVNLLMQTEKMSAKDALIEVTTKGSAANRVMNDGSRYMKTTTSFTLGYHRYGLIVKRNEDDCLKISAENGGKANTAKLSTVAYNLSSWYEELGQIIKEHLEETDLPKNEFNGLNQHLKDVCRKMEQLSDDLNSGKLTDRKEIYEKLFRYDLPAVFGNIIGVIVGELEELPNLTPVQKEFIQYLRGIPSQVREFRTQLAETYKTAVGEDMVKPENLEPVRNKLIEAANAGGMATGSSGEVPAGILSSLGDFIRQDPIVNSQKVDSLCAYLEKNGQAAMRFTKQQKADLKALLEKFVGSARAERALQRLVEQYETEFFAEHLRTADGSSKHRSMNPEAIYQHFLENKKDLLSFDPGPEQEEPVYKDINAID